MVTVTESLAGKVTVTAGTGYSDMYQDGYRDVYTGVVAGTATVTDALVGTVAASESLAG